MKNKNKIAVFLIILLLGIGFYFGFFPKNSSVISFSAKPLKYSEFMLENGAEVHLVHKSGSELITLIGVVKIRPEALEGGTLGAIHMLEHLIIEKYRNQINALGAVANGVTNDDSLMIELSFSKERWLDGIALFGQMINPIGLIDSETDELLEREKKNVIEEIKVHNSDINSKLWSQIVLDHYNQSVLGSEETITTMTVQNIQYTLENCFFTDKTLIIVIGNQLPKKLLDNIAECYGPANKSVNRLESKGSHLENRTNWSTVTTKECGDYVPLYMVWEGPDLEANTDDTYTAEVFCRLINQYDVFAERIKDNGLIRGYQFYYMPKYGGGDIVMYAVVDASRLEQAKTNITDVLADETIYELISEEMIQDNIKALQSEWFAEQQDIKEYSLLRAKIWAIYKADYADTYIEKLAGVTFQNIVEFSKQYLQRKEFFGVSAQKLN